MKALALTSYTATSCIGRGVEATLAALRERRTGLERCAFETVTLDAFVGEVAGVDEAPLPPGLREYECRNNRLAQLGLVQDGFAEAVRRSARRHGGGADRCGAGGRGRLAVPHHALRLSLPAAGVARPLPALRPRARRDLDRRSRGVRAPRARRREPRWGCGAAARGGRIERRLPHVRSASGGPRRPRRHARGPRDRRA